MRRSRTHSHPSLSERNQSTEMLLHFCFGVFKVHTFPLMSKFISEPGVERLTKRLGRSGWVSTGRRGLTKFIDLGLCLVNEHQQNVVKVHELLDRTCRLPRRANR